MTGEKIATESYQYLYRFLTVLDENQIYKLYKIVAGLLDISAFSPDEITHLEKRLSLAAVTPHFIPANKN